MKKKKILSILGVGVIALATGLTFAGCDSKNVDTTPVAEVSYTKQEAFDLLKVADNKIKYNIDGVLDNLKVTIQWPEDIVGDGYACYEYFYKNEAGGLTYFSEDMSSYDSGYTIVFKNQNQYVNYSSWSSEGADAYDNFFQALANCERELPYLGDITEDNIILVEYKNDLLKICVNLSDEYSEEYREFYLDSNYNYVKYVNYSIYNYEDLSRSVTTFEYGGVTEEDVAKIEVVQTTVTRDHL